MKSELEIKGEDAGLRFCASHFLPNHPKCGKLHGHNYVLDLRIKGEVKDSGEIIDFSEVKRLVRDELDTLDHIVVLPEHSKMSITQDEREVEVKNGSKRYIFPNEDVIFLPISNTTAEELSKYFADLIFSKLRDRVEELTVTVKELPGQGASYTTRG